MSLSELAATGEAVGGVAVLITLLYLAYQFRQTAVIERTAGTENFSLVVGIGSSSRRPIQV